MCVHVHVCIMLFQIHANILYNYSYPEWRNSRPLAEIIERQTVVSGACMHVIGHAILV